jgi:hypothetical protein
LAPFVIIILLLWQHEVIDEVMQNMAPTETQKHHILINLGTVREYVHADRSVEFLCVSVFLSLLTAD